MNAYANQLDALKPLVGNVVLDFCLFIQGRLVFFAHSNLILRSLIEFFGPEFVSIEEIDPDTDIFSLLWAE